MTSLVPERVIVQLAGDIHFAIGSGGSRANMLLESMPGGVDGLPDIGLPLRLNDQLFFFSFVPPLSIFSNSFR